VNAVMNIRFQNFGQFLDSLMTCWLLQTHCAAVHCINRTVQTVRRQKAVPCRSDSSSLLLPDLQLCSFSQHSALQSAPLRHIIPLTLSVSRSFKHRPSSLQQSRAVTSPAFHCEGLWSTPSRFMYEPWCTNNSTNRIQRTRLNFTSHFRLRLLCLYVSAVSSCRFTVQRVRYCYCTVISSHLLLHCQYSLYVQALSQ
jgi:hypothetical protein